jgi:hypothetical protein
MRTATRAAATVLENFMVGVERKRLAGRCCVFLCVCVLFCNFQICEQDDDLRVR